jgi:DNA (cytosine-5)-methyltransferase 1
MRGRLFEIYPRACGTRATASGPIGESRTALHLSDEAGAGLRRLRRDEPSKAITSAAVREFVHPTANRTLTLREAARLQTFDDSFRFHGTGNDQATLIGNAIPPRFAAMLSAAVHHHVTAVSAQADPLLEGTLVEFTVTSAESMSPALANVVDAVRTRYQGERLLPPALRSAV